MQHSAAFPAEVSSEIHFCHIGGKRERQQAGLLQGSEAPPLNMDEKHHIHPPSKKTTKKTAWCCSSHTNVSLARASRPLIQFIWNEYVDPRFTRLSSMLLPPHPPLHANASANALKQIIVHDLTSVPSSPRVRSQPALMQARIQNRIFSIRGQTRTHMHQTGCCFDIAEGNSPHYQNRSCFSARFFTVKTVSREALWFKAWFQIKAAVVAFPADNRNSRFDCRQTRTHQAPSEAAEGWREGRAATHFQISDYNEPVRYGIEMLPRFWCCHISGGVFPTIINLSDLFSTNVTCSVLCVRVFQNINVTQCYR